MLEAFGELHDRRRRAAEEIEQLEALFNRVPTLCELHLHGRWMSVPPQPHPVRVTRLVTADSW